MEVAATFFCESYLKETIVVFEGGNHCETAALSIIKDGRGVCRAMKAISKKQSNLVHGSSKSFSLVKRSTVALVQNLIETNVVLSLDCSIWMVLPGRIGTLW
jgi:hypothetical protein